MKQGKDVVVGDYVEVKKSRLVESRTGLITEAVQTEEVWIKARVAWIDEKSVSVIYDDGNQEMFERGRGLVRAAD